MKSFYFIVVVVLVVALLAGCNFVRIDQGQGIALQIAAKRVGYYVGQNNPEIAPVAKVIAQGIIGEGSDQDMIKAALDLGITELAKQFPDDPLLESDLKLIASTLQIDLPDSKIDIEQVKPLITAFIEGLEIGASRPK
jgi:predicted small secreted protein